MDDNIEVEYGHVHPNNEQLGIFVNPFPKTTQQPKGFIGSVSTSHCMKYYFSNRNGCRKQWQQVRKSHEKRKPI